MIRRFFSPKLEDLETVGDYSTSGGLTTSRLEAFSDGVFAVAITILVLGLQVPDLSSVITTNKEDALNAQMGELWPKFLTYVVSFVVVGIYWVAHNATFHYIKRTNRFLFWLNLIYLMGVSSLPFTTSLLGSYYTYRLPIIIYAGAQAVTGTLFHSMVLYATFNGLSNGPKEANFIKIITYRNMMGPILYLVAIIASFIATWISLAIFVIVPILYILPGAIDRDWQQRFRESHTHHLDTQDAQLNSLTPSVNTPKETEKGEAANDKN